MSDVAGVMTVDDHAVIHTGLQAALAGQVDLRWLGAVDELDHVVPAVTAAEPDVVLLDLWVGEHQSWDVCRELCALQNAPNVAIFSGYGNSQLLDRAMREGALGYILKSAPPERITAGVRDLAGDKACWDPELLAAWTRDYRARSSPRLFTERELEIVRLIAEGKDNYEIAADLHLSTHTVKYHIARALRRTGEANRAALVRRATADQVL